MGDLDDIAGSNPAWFRYLVIAALLSGAGGGIVGLGKDTTDRYKGSDAKADFEKRDRKIEHLREVLEGHLQHSARYSERIDRYLYRIERLESEIASLEKRLNNDE